MNFLAPEMLLGLLLIPLAIGFYLGRSDGAAATRSGSRTSICSPTSLRADRRGAATSRPRCTSVRSRRS